MSGWECWSENEEFSCASSALAVVNDGNNEVEGTLWVCTGFHTHFKIQTVT